MRLSFNPSPAVAVHDTLRRRAPRAGRTTVASRTGRAVTLRWPRSGAKAETARIWEADIVESSATKRLPPSKDAAASLSAERVKL